MEPQQPPSATEIPTELPPEIPPFPRKYNTLMFVPVIMPVLLASAAATGGSNLIVLQPVMILVAVVAIGFLLYAQTNYFQQFYPNKKIIPQLISLALVLLLPVIAINLGDVYGAAHYDVEVNGIGSSTGLGLLLGAILATGFATVFAIGNTLYIATRGTSGALKIFGRALYWLGYAAITAVSFMCYAIIYSLHDPSTE